MAEMWHEHFLSEIIGEITLHDRRPCLLDEGWFIDRLIRYNAVEDYEICIEEQEIIWAVIVYYEAYDVADWMDVKGYTATGDSYEDAASCVPYDAARWD